MNNKLVLIKGGRNKRGNKPIKHNENIILIKQTSYLPIQIGEIPECTILLPVYNNRDDVMNAITSVINQTFKNWELIIIDDCSTDGTNDSITHFLNNSQYNITLIRNPVNQGTYVSLNEGLKIARGKYIARIDSDDVMNKRMLEEHIKILHNSNCVASQSKYIREGGEKRYGEITFVYKRNIINKLGYYDSVRFGADSEFITRVKRIYGKARIFKIDKVLYYAKQRNQSLTTSALTGLYGEGGLIRKEYADNYLLWHETGHLYMPYPLTNRPFPVSDKMLPNRR